MKQVKLTLLKRRKIGLFILGAIGILGYVIDLYYPFSPPAYINAKWHMPLVYILIVYKVIELGIFYLIFYRKHYLKLIESEFHLDFVDTFKKNAKRFFFLVPQGSIVFGILSYKLSGDIEFLWLFLIIAAMTLLMVNPKKLKE